MNHRYAVHAGDRPFASVHAATAEEAIRLACSKTTSHDPKHCTVTTVMVSPFLVLLMGASMGQNPIISGVFSGPRGQKGSPDRCRGPSARPACSALSIFVNSCRTFSRVRSFSEAFAALRAYRRASAYFSVLSSAAAEER